MFDFTTENVLNDLSRVSSASGALTIQRLNKYLVANAGKVYKRAGTAAVKEVNTITVTGTATGTYRLALDITMSGSYPIDYDRWAINKGKPFYVEVAITSAPASATALATALVAGIKKGLKKYNGANINDVVVASSGANITITAQNEYQRIKGAVIGILNAAGEDFVTLATGAVTTPGAEGFGTAWNLTKNLRLPTQEATRFQGEDQDERPVNGVVYNQYSFQYTADRNFTGTGAVGQKIQSKTTHVLFVPSTLATTFEGHITTAFGNDSILDAASGASVNPA